MKDAMPYLKVKLIFGLGMPTQQRRPFALNYMTGSIAEDTKAGDACPRERQHLVDRNDCRKYFVCTDGRYVHNTCESSFYDGRGAFSDRPPTSGCRVV